MRKWEALGKVSETGTDDAFPAGKCLNACTLSSEMGGQNLLFPLKPDPKSSTWVVVFQKLLVLHPPLTAGELDSSSPAQDGYRAPSFGKDQDLMRMPRRI